MLYCPRLPATGKGGKTTSVAFMLFFQSGFFRKSKQNPIGLNRSSLTRLPAPSEISLSAKGNYLTALHIINYYEGYLWKFLISNVFRSTSYDHSSHPCFYSLIWCLWIVLCWQFWYSISPDCCVLTSRRPGVCHKIFLIKKSKMRMSTTESLSHISRTKCSWWLLQFLSS